MQIVKKIFIATLLHSVAATGAVDSPTVSELAAFDGPAIYIAMDDAVACVPRRFFSAYEAKTFSEAKNPDGSPRPITPGRLELTTFLPNLEGYTNELFRDYVRNRYDRRLSPSSWVRVELLNQEVAKFFRNSATEYESFEASQIESTEITSRRRKAACVGKTAGFGAGFLVTAGEECAIEELKGKSIDGVPVEALCAPFPGTNRCHVRTVQNSGGIAFKYDFKIQHLADWDQIHRLVSIRVREWATDKSCVK